MFTRSICSSLALVSIAFASALMGQPHDGGAQRLVLVTNDNGIDDPKIVALARAFAAESETWVVAPDRDQSGTGNHITFMRTGGLIAERRDIGAGIEAFAVSGTPGDCVALATRGLMGDRLPDLVVSGINGGDNSGEDWMFSGTVGAARVAAIGLPAIAVSGLDDDLPGAVEAAADWVVRLSHHEVVTSLRPGEYLTVSLPRIRPEEIRGVKIVDRALGVAAPRFATQDGETWQVVGIDPSDAPIPEGSDRAAIAAGYIAVVPMTLNEVDLQRLARWRRQDLQLPAWREGVEGGGDH